MQSVFKTVHDNIKLLGFENLSFIEKLRKDMEGSEHTEPKGELSQLVMIKTLYMSINREMEDIETTFENINSL